MGQVLGEIFTKISGAVTAVGVIVFLIGVVSFAMAFRETGSGGGAQINASIVGMISGVLISAAAVYFGMIDTSWAS